MRTRRRSIGRKTLVAASLLLVVLTNAVRASASTGAPVIENVTVNQIGVTTATLGAVVGPDGTDTSTWFQYGVIPGPPYASSTPVQDIGAGLLATSVTANLSDLLPSTKYYVELTAQNAAGTVTVTLDFKTLNASAPIVTTMAMADKRSGLELDDVSCPAVGLCWAVGVVNKRSGSTAVIDEFRAGSWVAAGVFPSHFLMGINCPTSNDCWAVGSNQANDPLPVALHYDGRKWSSVPVPIPAGTTVDRLQAVTCESTRLCWAVGGVDGATAQGMSLVERWNGRTWSIVPSPGPRGDSFLQSVSCSSSQSCWAVGIANDMREPVAALVEHWNGSSWSLTKTPPVPYGLYDVSCRWVSACFATGGKLLQLVGGRWQITSTGYGMSIAGLDCSSPSRCWSVSSYGDRSVAGTWTWAATNAPMPPVGYTSLINAVTCETNGTCVAVGAEMSGPINSLSSLLHEHALGEQIMLGST